jgi:hypothetical protein
VDSIRETGTAYRILVGKHSEKVHFYDGEGDIG